MIGLELGRRVGPTLRESKLVRKHGAAGWDKAAAQLRKHGRWSLFVGRLIPFGLVQSVVPAAAGATHMSYRTFLPPVALGAACSTALPLLAGVGVAAGLKNANDLMLIILGGLLLLVVAVIVIRKLRANTRAKKSVVALWTSEAVRRESQDRPTDRRPVRHPPLHRHGHLNKGIIGPPQPRTASSTPKLAPVG
ncbi:VTT domain-containing protein [Nonomuraea sp. NPDC046802]|uniref:DedA family protein n=1 Tax=Nonomuraea sp. NPDC046802 TaxID=3154919 RepID=UPI00340CB595